MASKTYVLTGVSNGIGQALASLLKMAGHVVIGLDIARPKDTIDNFIELDLNDQSSIETAVNRVPDAFDGVCNCAGLPPRHGLSEKILSVNFLGTRTLTNFLQPKLVGDSVGLHPVWLMFALFAFGSLFGFVGMLIAVPAAAAIGVLVRFGLSQYLDSDVYQNAPTLFDASEEDTEQAKSE